MNGTYIYALVKDKPIVVTIPTNPSRIVVTDGFHITHPFELNPSHTRTHHFKIECGIENEQLLVGLIMSAIVYTMGATSGLILLQLLSIAPIIYFLFIYYIRRREFIQIKPL